MRLCAAILLTAVTIHATAASQESDSTHTHQLPQVVITGSNIPTGRNLLPYTVSTIGADLELKGINTLYVHPETPSTNFATLNLRLAWQLQPQLLLLPNLDNITDTQYTITHGYPMPRFTNIGGLRLSL